MLKTCTGCTYKVDRKKGGQVKKEGGRKKKER